MAQKREVTQAKSCYAQADIDTLLRRGIPQQESARRLPKGLTPQTLRWCASGLTTIRRAIFRQTSWRRRCRYPWCHAVNT